MPSGSSCGTPASLPLGREGPRWQLNFSPLVFTREQSFALWVHLGHCTALEFSHRKSPIIIIICLSSVPTVWMLCHVSPLRLSSGTQAQSLPKDWWCSLADHLEFVWSCCGKCGVSSVSDSQTGADAPPCPASTRCWQTWASEPLLRWKKKFHALNFSL